jgi:hypothetical protein
MTTKQKIKESFASIGINLTESQYENITQAIGETIDHCSDVYEKEEPEHYKQAKTWDKVIFIKNVIKNATTYGSDEKEMD